MKMNRALDFGAANGFWTLLLFLALNGLAQGTGWPGCIGSLAFWFKRRQRGSVLGVWAPAIRSVRWLRVPLPRSSLVWPDSCFTGLTHCSQELGAIDAGSKPGALTAAGIINGMGSIGPIFQEKLIARMYQAYN